MVVKKMSNKKRKGRNNNSKQRVPISTTPANDDDDDNDITKDYAKMADSFSKEDDDDDDHEEEEDDDHDDDESSSNSDDSDDNDEKDEVSDDDDDDDSSAEDEKNEEKDDDESSSSEDDDDDDDDGSDDDEETEEEEYDDETEESPTTRHEPQKPKFQSSSSEPEGCTFDLRNLVAMNSHQIQSTIIKKRHNNSNKKNKSNNNNEEENITIPSSDKLLRLYNQHQNKSKGNTPNTNIIFDEDLLLQKATNGCTQLISAIFTQLPIDRSCTDSNGPMVTLPEYNEIKLPRSLPPPPPKQETKWEKFAKERGIGINQEKLSRKVWDEASQTWMYRHGYQKANASEQEWPIMEVKKNDDPYDDPWEKMREKKKQRVDKNLENQMRNQERSGSLPKGTTNKVMKNKAKAREAGKQGNQAQQPSLIPVDLAKTTNPKQRQRGKESINKALIATQHSTASLGKFDQMRDGEPERKKLYVPGNNNKKNKRSKYETSTSKKVMSTESQRGMKLLNAVMTNKGKNATGNSNNKGAARHKGETAYDYEYNDGLNPNTFQKKKGRGGVGKMKKITKKRSK